MKVCYNSYSIDIIPESEIEMVYLKKIIGMDENLDAHVKVDMLNQFGTKSMYGITIKKEG